MSEGNLYTLYGKPDLREASLIAGWHEDVAGLGSHIIEYLIRLLKAVDFCAIEPEQFFAMEGVTVQDDIAHFPESRFYCAPEKNIVLFLSSVPSTEWHTFLDLVVDIAVNHCDVRQIYTVGGMVGNVAHTQPRSLFSVFTDSKTKDDFMKLQLSETIDYESPPGQRPTISSYLCWTAGGKGIPGINLWVPIPFYLVETVDAQAYRRILDAFNRSLLLGLDLSPLDEDIGRQKENIARIVADHPELNDYLRKLESRLALTEEESEHMVDLISRNLKR